VSCLKGLTPLPLSPYLILLPPEAAAIHKCLPPATVGLIFRLRLQMLIGDCVISFSLFPVQGTIARSNYSASYCLSGKVEFASLSLRFGDPRVSALPRLPLTIP